MHKKIIFILLSLCFFLSGCVSTQSGTEDNTVKTEYIKSVFIAYFELKEFTINKTESEFKKEINKTFKKLSSNGFNRVTVHVRPFADAFYNSSYFPTSEYFTGVQGGTADYDALSVMTELAHKNKLTIEAWINPYRVSATNDFSKLSKDNKAFEWKDTGKVFTCDTGIYFNPADEDVNELIVNGVKEIAQNYNVDSICFDDYFYPTKSDEIDESYYNEYKSNGGDLSLQDFRRDNVNKLISSVYSAIKSVNENITFGISPASDMSSDYSSLYADVIKWSQNEGYVDYICPQIYFGFENEAQPFMKTVKLWCSTAECDLYVALPLYKAGKEDKFAGELGKKEFIDNSNIISRQVNYLSKLDKVRGYYIFSYSSLNDNEETLNLYSAMQNSSE